MEDEELVDLLMDTLGANDLRAWMSDHGVPRSRGASKKQSAELAVEQERELVFEILDQKYKLTPDPHYIGCKCGYNKNIEDEVEVAIEIAKEHECEHEPQVWADGGNTLVFGSRR